MSLMITQGQKNWPYCSKKLPEEVLISGFLFISKLFLISKANIIFDQILKLQPQAKKICPAASKLYRRLPRCTSLCCGHATYPVLEQYRRSWILVFNKYYVNKNKLTYNNLFISLKVGQNSEYFLRFRCPLTSALSQGTQNTQKTLGRGLWSMQSCTSNGVKSFLNR